jgi:hypothetical protein
MRRMREDEGLGNSQPLQKEVEGGPNKFQESTPNRKLTVITEDSVIFW